MKLSQKTLIAQEKLTKYLLVLRKRNDKSQWLAKAGYDLDNWKILEKNLREQILPMDATPIEIDQFGQKWEIKGELVGPNGKSLSVCTIWMTETETKITKFITIFPNKKES